MTIPTRVIDARRLAHQLLAPVGDRYRHSAGVAAAAARVATLLPDDDATVLVAAAWLHDIGYAPACIDTGLHALDGALELRRRGWPPRIVRLVAHHSMARYEATARNLTHQLRGLGQAETGPVADALTWADMTTSPAGHPTTIDQRLTDILHRYPTTHTVHRAITAATPALRAAVTRTEQHLTAGAIQPI